ncbi:MAG: gliding motility-associated C-terminal domain-containing protein [Bacteroidia bacterium]
MKWLAVFLLFPIASLCQQVDEFFVTTEIPLNIATPTGLVIDSNDNANIFFWIRPDTDNDTSFSYILNDFSKSRYSLSKNRIQYFRIEPNKPIKAIRENYIDSHLTVNPEIVLNGIEYNFYIISDIIPIDGNFDFLGQKLKIDTHCMHCTQLIKTDKSNSILESKTLVLPTYSGLNCVLDKNDNLLLLVRSLNETAEYKIDSITILPNGKKYSYNLIRINSDLQATNFLRYKSSNNPVDYSPVGYGSWYLGAKHFLKEGMHIANLSADNFTSVDSFHYGLNYLHRPFSIEKLDSFWTNLFFNSTAELDGKLFFTASYSSKSLFLKDLKWTSPVEKGLVIGSIDSLGKIELLDFIEIDNPGFRGSKIKVFNDKLFVRLNINGQFEYNGSTYGEDFQLSEYFLAYGKKGNRRLFIKSPGEYSNISIGQSDEFIVTDNYIHLLSQVGIDFTINDSTIRLPSNDDRFNNTMYAKIRYSFAPVERPLFTIDSTNCNSALITIYPTDADHYTLLVSTDTLAINLNQGANYNYSPDYLIAPTLDKHRVLYQGSDTSVILKNLPSNVPLYFTLIPGNGNSGAVNYNFDSFEMKTYVIRASVNKPSISPANDISSCQSDSIFATASSSSPIRWMDGKTENRRFVPESDEYYFTIKDSQGCVVSSDTVTITKHPNPQINRIVATQKPPFCMGDTIVFAPNTLELPQFQWPKSYSAIATKTGWQVVSIETKENCITKDSIYVEFGQKPNFKFLQDSVLSMNNRIQLNYESNADSLLWVYGLDSANGYTNYAVTDSQYLFVNAIDESGCNVWDSIVTMYKEPVSEAFPNAFSPNGDDVNDEWYFLHPDTAGTLIIYNRRGGIVHHGPNRWDGKKNGETLPVGAYRYTFIFEENGEEKIKRGLISLIR